MSTGLRPLVVEVAPRSYLAVWQQKFSSIGINVMCQAITTNPDTAKQVQNVDIVYVTRAVQFIKDIQVRLLLQSYPDLRC